MMVTEEEASTAIEGQLEQEQDTGAKTDPTSWVTKGEVDKLLDINNIQREAIGRYKRALEEADIHVSRLILRLVLSFGSLIVLVVLFFRA